MSQSQSFVHLGARSDASFGDSIAQIDELCWEASKDEQGYLALTDVNTLAQAPAFSTAAARAGLRPIFGAEVFHLPLGEHQYRGKVHRVRLLVESEAGWRNLLSIVNEARQEANPSRPPYIRFETILTRLQGLLLLTGGNDGELASHLLNQDIDKTESFLQTCLDATDSSRVFVEIPNPETSPKQLPLLLNQVADHLSLYPVAVPTIRAAQSNDDPLFLLSRDVEKRNCKPTLKEYIKPLKKREFLKSRHQVAQAYKGYETALTASLAIAEYCSNFQLPNAERRFPVSNFCRGVDAESYIWNNAFSKATERYGELSNRYKERLNREYREIVDAGLAPAIIALVRLNDELERFGVQRGPGAGIFTNSMIASLLGITQLDPLRFDLPFELPAGLGSGSFPLLEMSIPENQEKQAVQALKVLFENQVLPVGEWKPWKANQYLDFFQRGNEKGKGSSQLAKDSGYLESLEESRKSSGGYLPDAEQRVDSPSVLGWLAGRMEGRLKEIGTKKGIYTFSVDGIHRYLPTRHRLAQETSKDIVSEWGEEELGRLRFGRIKFQHSAMLDLIGEATENVRQQGQIDYSPERTRADDPATYRLLREGLTLGIPPLEKPLIRRVLRVDQPSSLHELIDILLKRAKLDDKREELGFSTLLLCHVCAAIKAHHPKAFYAAALTQASKNKERLACLLEEVSRRKIPIADLDINYSEYKWRVERDYIRPGMIFVQSIREASGKEIMAKRQEMHFTDLADFLRRLEKGKLKAHQFQDLAFAGAFDNFTGNRIEVMKQVEELYPILGGKRNSQEPSDELAFFDRDGSWWLQENISQDEKNPLTPQEPEPSQLWEDEERACGFSIHRVLVEEEQQYLKNANVQILERISVKTQKKRVSLIGHLGQIESSHHQQDQWFFDINGCLVSLDAELFTAIEEKKMRGRIVLVSGVLSREPFQWTMKLERIELLTESMSEHKASEFLTLDLSELPIELVKNVYQVVKRFPGDLPIQMKWVPLKGPRVYSKIAHAKMTLCPQLKVELDQLLGDRWSTTLAQGEKRESPRRSVFRQGYDMSSKAVRKLTGLLSH